MGWKLCACGATNREWGCDYRAEVGVWAGAGFGDWAVGEGLWGTYKGPFWPQPLSATPQTHHTTPTRMALLAVLNGVTPRICRNPTIAEL
jgi:hypothetical protein